MFLLCSKTSTIQQYNNVDWLLRDLSCFRPEGKTSSVSELLGSIYASWSLLGPCFRSSLKLLRPGHGKEQHMCSCSSLQYVFPCVTYPKDVSNETAVTVTIRVLAVQFLFISIQKYCTNGSFLMANSLSEFFSAWYFGQTNRSAHATHTGGMKSCHQRGVKNCNPLDQDLTASD